MKLHQIKENNQKNQEYIIAIDMDGVLADFEAKAEELMGMSMDQVPKKEFWSKMYWYNNNVEPWFENLPMMKDAQKLFNYITDNFANYYILTATGKTPKDAGQQKENWIKKKFGHDIKIITVEKSADKAHHANPNSILIDDREKSIGPWKQAGGIGILHKNANDTIQQLRTIIL